MNPGNHKDFIFLVSLGPILFPGSLRTSKEISNPFKMSPLRLRHERDVDSQAWKTRNRKTCILKCTDCKSMNCTHLPCCKCFASNYSDMHEIQIVVMLSSRIQNTLLALSTIFCRVLSLGPSFSAPLSTQLKYPRLISILTAPFLPVSITGTYPTCIPSSYCRY